MTSGNIVAKTFGEFTPNDVFEMAVLRSEVFFLEQHIDEEEFDHHDREETTLHLWCRDEGGMQAYLRLVHDDTVANQHDGIADSLGRMVVRADMRGQGLAKKLLNRALVIHGERPLYLHSQEYITPLYEKVGFVAVGDPFQEAGITHQLMIRSLDA